jgi:IS30 family transposase
MRKYRRLARQDRITIERRLEQGKKKIEIAEELGVHRSSISREISRNKALHGPYRWRGAQAKTERGKRMAFGYSRKIKGPLEELVMQFLEEYLSPEQISNRLKLEGARWSVSHETIYKWIYYIAPDFKKCLRWKSRCRKKRGERYRRGLHKLPRKFIDVRPLAANLRTEPGHWERDLLEGIRSGPALLVIQDRVTRITIIRKVNSKHCNVVNQATAEALQGQVVRTITNDNGIEFGKYEDLERALGVPIYFCHAYTSWERGTVENTNGLLRQFFPKGIDFSTLTAEDIQLFEDTINKRPRKTLGYRSPIEVHRNISVRLVRSERFYREQNWKREQQAFKRDMIRETGFYLEPN